MWSGKFCGQEYYGFTIRYEMERQFLLFFLIQSDAKLFTVRHFLTSFPLLYIPSSLAFPSTLMMILKQGEVAILTFGCCSVSIHVIVVSALCLCVRLTLNMDGIPVVFSARKSITIDVTWDECAWNAFRFFSVFLNLSGARFRTYQEGQVGCVVVVIMQLRKIKI